MVSKDEFLSTLFYLTVLLCDFLELKEGVKGKMQEGKERTQDMTARIGDKAHGQYRRINT